MKRYVPLSLCIGFCLFLILIYFEGELFEKKALARGQDSINHTLKVEPLKTKVDEKVYKAELNQKNTNLEIKRSLITKSEKKGPNYDINPNDGTDFKKVFENSLFVGDSITNGLSYYKHLSPKNVIADIGQSIAITKKKKMDLIKKSNAKSVYVMLGLNDSVYIEETEKFIKAYEDLLKNIKEVLPEAKLNVMSILPINHGDDKKLTTMNERVTEFNKALIKLCKDKEINYIDIRPFIEAHKDFYAKDGMHVSWEFYKYWLKFIETNYIK